MQRDDPESSDAAWRSIVDNYGERVLEPEEIVVAAPVAEEPEHAELVEDPDDFDEDGFIPETPPPIPRPSPDRFLAWLGVFGSPTILLICLIFSLSVPSLLSWVLIGGFIGGFCYLVFTDPREPRDPWDNGAVV